jgi:uncharacterized protein
MSIVVCDASPLIFLAKLDQLDLIPSLLGGRIFVLRCVVKEILSASATPGENSRMNAFLKGSKIVDFEEPTPPAGALSRSDQLTLKWAVRKKADWIVADERLLRRVAISEGLSVIGFLGLLVEGARRGSLTAVAAKQAINESVSRHQCRISVALYQRVMAELESLP